MMAFSLPGVVPGRPAEAVLFQRGAGVLVGLFVKEDLEPVRFQVADDLTAGELCAVGGLLGLLGALVQLVEAGLDPLDLAAKAGQFVVRDGRLDPGAAFLRVGKAGGELGGGLGAHAGDAVEGFVLAVVGVQGLAFVELVLA